MAQSAESTMAAAVDSIRSMVPGGAVWSSTLSMRVSSWDSPMRQGTHLPQVCAWHRRRKFSARSTGHSPGGLAATRCPISRHRSCTTCWARSGVSMESLRIVVPPFGRAMSARGSGGPAQAAVLIPVYGNPGRSSTGFWIFFTFVLPWQLIFLTVSPWFRPRRRGRFRARGRNLFAFCPKGFIMESKKEGPCPRRPRRAPG